MWFIEFIWAGFEVNELQLSGFSMYIQESELKRIIDSLLDILTAFAQRLVGRV